MVKLALAILVGSTLVGLWTFANVAAAGSSRAFIWDTGEKHTEKHYDLRPYKNRDSWKQAPYETTEYQFKGSSVVENDFFYIYFHASKHDSIFLYAKKDGKPGIWTNEIYKVYVGPDDYNPEFPGDASRARRRNYGHGAAYTKIIKNTSEEVVVESGSIPYDREGKTISVVTTYRVPGDKPWVEVAPVSMATEQGIHGKVRMGLAPNESGNDFVVDSLRDLPGRLHPPSSKMLICFFESTTNPFMWVFTWTSPFEKADPWFLNNSGSGGDTMWCSPGTWGGLTIPRSWSGCITSSWANFGKNGSVIIGALTHWNNWYREQVDKPVKKGETYTSEWKPPYPGRWRMTVRLAERRYDQGFKYDGKTEFPAKYFSRDVYNGDFTFESPIVGHLDYIIMYMYDRIEETPEDILTPMDQYRWTLEQKK